MHAGGHHTARTVFAFGSSRREVFEPHPSWLQMNCGGARYKQEREKRCFSLRHFKSGSVALPWLFHVEELTLRRC